MKKLGRFAGRLGKPVVRQLYALYYLWESEHTPKRAKMIIVGALVYFLSPIDSVLPIHFIEIAHAKEQNGLWMLGLNAKILLHQGGFDGFCHSGFFLSFK